MSSSYQASPIRDLGSYSYRDTLGYSPVTPVITKFVVDDTQRLQQLLIEKQHQITTLKQTIHSLEQQLTDKASLQTFQYERIKSKLQAINNQQQEQLKTLHSHQVEFLLKEVAQQRAANESLNKRLELQSEEIERFRQGYESKIANSANEIKTLNQVIASLQQAQNTEIRNLNYKRQLQKSRTTGLIESRRQNSNFMDRQVRKMNEQMMQKTLQIESLSKQLNRQRRKHEDTIRSHNIILNETRTKYEQQLQEQRQVYMRGQRLLKEQIKQLKQQIMSYVEQIDQLELKIEMKEKEVERVREELVMRKQEIEGLKVAMERQREEHGNQIMNLMKQRRKSRSQIGSSRSIISLRESAVIIDSPESLPSPSIKPYQPSSKIQNNLHPIKQQTPQRLQPNDYSRQLADSQLHQQEGLTPIQSELERAVYHYDTLIEELKRNHEQELELFKINDKKLRTRLQAKEQELLDILTKFSPLVKIHAGEKSLQQDRKERIERHWKGDVALLEVLLKKYKIKAYQIQ